MKIAIFSILLLAVTLRVYGQEIDANKIFEEKEEALIAMQARVFIAKERFFKGLSECAKTTYLEMFREASETSGFPEDKLLEIILLESGCDPTAKNRSGASGIGQIMPLTGKNMGLVKYGNIKKTVVARRKGKITRIPVYKKVIVRDDRFNPKLATMASAKHLAGLAERFGNINNAIWAYHAGEGLVNRFISVAKKTPGWENEDMTPTKLYFIAHSGENPQLAEMIAKFDSAKHDWTPTYPFRVACAGRLFKSYLAGTFNPEDFSCSNQETKHELPLDESAH
ncbi:hypothetical protein A3B05_00910 [Candidatus Giovannonibacteria bacterium RIFCSPLOWO2_01_FULL_43_160]|uniref:Lytic transglycosylase, catalytic n=2 Tax=Candidatus Giovannoniibacteriota TaxID=1752738 RepID=A0A0G1L560_9BACT|nr:MAG: Lytic transglycosylase, catalytic [Candidatus Giovannonibacteria bacterium GW2011_GWB1_43_13]KKS99682.1 MAG: Lytic transglycosylase, catalytic [Candidatus Giovannonibacteria bacterium GW2011_GWA1_43_15]KKT63767.1 MAG: Lytic transglycosylase, catalytic [Candidatus Giovannonibacteria bacterium GW2011_GWA2_44_26]OGF58261.1 MAG: hypothetical protein A2652_00210 [Candidatus Giovannonibacteria bacterium RIFCSPHIGHO2_01_FULL_43_140]OGF70553.1 MAG: hypothetical protein A3C76_00620 [Candidatus G